MVIAIAELAASAQFPLGGFIQGFQRNPLCSDLAQLGTDTF